MSFSATEVSWIEPVRLVNYFDMVRWRCEKCELVRCGYSDLLIEVWLLIDLFEAIIESMLRSRNTVCLSLPIVIIWCSDLGVFLSDSSSVALPLPCSLKWACFHSILSAWLLPGFKKTESKPSHRCISRLLNRSSCSFSSSYCLFSSSSSSSE